MIKCPKCNEEIDSLMNVVEVSHYYELTLIRANTEPYYEGVDEQAFDGGPNCSETLFTDEQEAIDFLAK